VVTFLYNKTLRVGIRGSYSSWFDMLSGVPQGSVLGPILFLLYINKLPSWILSSIRMFADDTKVWRVIETDLDCAALQMDRDVLLKWSDQWLLRFTLQKRKVMSLGHSREYNYVMSDAVGTFVIENNNKRKEILE